MMKPRVELYSTGMCGYCVAAKNLLVSRGLGYEEVRVDADPALREAMRARAGGRTSVPQVFIDGELVGGYQELAEWLRSGRLEAWMEKQA